MTDEEKKSPPTKSEFRWLSGFLTVQNVVQLTVIVGAISSFYWKTNDRIEALEKQQHRDEARMQYHQEWLEGLAVKTQTPPPSHEITQ